MSTQNNPFVLPGFGHSGDAAANPLMAGMEMMQQAWTNLAGAGGLAQAMPVPMGLEDLDRRIAELRTVENWLKMNLSMLSGTIQGMEVQRATIATLKSFASTASTGDGPSPLEVVLGLKPAATPSAASQSAAADAATSAPESDGGADMPDPSAAAASATQAWWDLMQQQFGQLASAAAASMTDSAAAASTATSQTAAASSKAAAKKAPAKKAAPRKRSAAPAKAARKKSV